MIDILVQLANVLRHLCLPVLPLADSGRQIVEISLPRLHALRVHLVSGLRHDARVFDGLGLLGGFSDLWTDGCPHLELPLVEWSKGQGALKRLLARF